MTRKIIATTLCALFVVCSGAGFARAQADYPSKPVTVIVPFAAGGPTVSGIPCEVDVTNELHGIPASGAQQNT